MELGGLPQLREVAVEPWAAREQLEDARLIQNIHLIFPDHVIYRRKLPPVAHQQRCESSHFILHGQAAPLLKEPRRFPASPQRPAAPPRSPRRLAAPPRSRQRPAAPPRPRRSLAAPPHRASPPRPLHRPEFRPVL